MQKQGLRCVLANGGSSCDGARADVHAIVTADSQRIQAQRVSDETIVAHICQNLRQQQDSGTHCDLDLDVMFASVGCLDDEVSTDRITHKQSTNNN